MKNLWLYCSHEPFHYKKNIIKLMRNWHKDWKTREHCRSFMFLIKFTKQSLITVFPFYTWRNWMSKTEELAHVCWASDRTRTGPKPILLPQHEVAPTYILNKPFLSLHILGLCIAWNFILSLIYPMSSFFIFGLARDHLLSLWLSLTQRALSPLMKLYITDNIKPPNLWLHTIIHRTLPT